MSDPAHLPDPVASLAVHLDELRTLLRDIAGGSQPSRKHAVDYLNHRSFLLDSPMHALLPGFLYQCVTIDRFREFIFLYDRDVELRRQFVDRMIDRASALCASGVLPEQQRDDAPIGSVWKF